MGHLISLECDFYLVTIYDMRGKRKGLLLPDESTRSLLQSCSLRPGFCLLWEVISTRVLGD